MHRPAQSGAVDQPERDAQSLGRSQGLLQVHGAAEQHAPLPVQRDLAATHAQLHDPLLFRAGGRCMRVRRPSEHRFDGRGQALVEFALVFPLFVLLLMAIITFGLYVFYNQQLQNAAREAARFAAVNSSTAQCPVVSRINPIGPLLPGGGPAGPYSRCDAPELGWPKMTAAARS